MSANNNFNLPINFYRMGEDPRAVECIQYLAKTYPSFVGDYLITFYRELTFLKDEKFIRLLNEHPESFAKCLAWRLHTACWAAQHALLLEGDFMECGVENAITTTQIVNYLDFQNVDKQFYLYDTFGGIPEHYVEQAKLANINHYDKNADLNYAKVCKRFASYKNIHITKGELPATFNVVCPDKIAFLHLDLSNFPAEYDVLKILLPKMVTGSIVLFQGFGYSAYELYKIKDAEYLKERGLSILELPTGQGLLIV